MSDWKELKIDNLPSDILVGDYEFESWNIQTPYLKESPWKPDSPLEINRMVEELCKDTVLYVYRYRLRQPEPPTHEEIMTSGKYWNDDEGHWVLVQGYCQKSKQYFMCFEEETTFPTREWFTGRESATLPPETK